MTELNSINNPSQEDTIDIKALLFQALSYWKIFVLAVGLSLSIAYFFNRYTDPIYEASIYRSNLRSLLQGAHYGG